MWTCKIFSLSCRTFNHYISKSFAPVVKTHRLIKISISVFYSGEIIIQGPLPTVTKKSVAEKNMDLPFHVESHGGLQATWLAQDIPVDGTSSFIVLLVPLRVCYKWTSHATFGTILLLFAFVVFFLVVYSAIVFFFFSVVLL